MKKLQSLAGALGVAVLMAYMATATVQAQVPADILAGLKKIGQIVDPACTAKLYRPLMPVKDYNTYWPVGATGPATMEQLYPGVTIARDVSFGPNPKDVIDIFTADKGGDNRTVLMYVPGGGGNKIEQQEREGNAFYDNIGRWATKNGMVGVTVQRHPGMGNWDDGGRDISLAVDYVKANITKYKGNPNRIFIWAQSAGNGPTGVYVGHPERWAHGVGVVGAIFMSGNPVPGLGGGAAGGRGAAPAGGAPAAG
ncbi:MAG: carboxylesterase family protein, partial [Vicinamibacterales bacterium]